MNRNHGILLALVYIVSMSLIYYYYNTSHIIQTHVQTESTTPPPTTAIPQVEAVLVQDQRDLPQINASSLSPRVLEFLDIASQSGATVFVIEPCILWKACSAKEKNKLHRRRAVPDFARTCSRTEDGNNYFTTLAIFDSDMLTLQSDGFRSKLATAGFNITDHSDLAVRAGKTTHLLIRKKRAVIHVVVFFQRNFFLQIHALPSVSYGISQTDLRFGRDDAAFENITLTLRRLNGKTVLIPTENLRFLFEIKHSKFLECRFDLAEKHNKKYPLTGEPLVDLIGTLQAIRNVTYHTLLPVWMDGGSLIGWARHCGAVPYERDADFASDARYLGTDWSIPKEVVDSVWPPWYFIETFGLPWTSYEMRLYNVQLGWQVDLFFMTQDEEDKSQVYSGYHTFPGVYYVKVYYNKTIFEHICSAEVLGMKIHVPCDYDALLTTEYGPEWVTPDEHHFLKHQPRQHRTYWDENESTFAYQCLGRNQFSIRDSFKHTDYRYSTRKEHEPERENKALENALDEYKSVCTRLRWDRTS